MNSKIKITVTAFLLIFTSTQQRLCNHVGLGQNKSEGESERIDADALFEQQPKVTMPSDYYVSDTIYQWDDEIFEWVAVEDSSHLLSKSKKTDLANILNSKEPIVVDWEVLMNIEYKLKYFAELEMDIYAPEFPEAVKALDGKEVIIEGFVIPFEEEGLLSLSHYPFAACFFCGKASPASIISMYMKNQNKRYKIDDFKKFKGMLRLNHDNPNEFYYILEEATEL